MSAASRFAPVQQHVRLPAHDAGGRTRRVEQDRVERGPSRHAAGSVASAARDSISSPSRAKVSMRRTRARRRRARDDAQRRIALGEVRGLAAGRGAGVEHAAARRRRSASATACALPSCTETSPASKPGNSATGSAFEPQRVDHAVDDVCFDAGLAQALRVIVAGTAAAIHAATSAPASRFRRRPHPHLRANRCEGTLRQPFRPRRARVDLRRGLAQRAPQQRVHQPGTVRAPVRARAHRQWHRPRRAAAGPVRSSCADPAHSSARSSPSRRPGGFGIHAAIAAS